MQANKPGRVIFGMCHFRNSTDKRWQLLNPTARVTKPSQVILHSGSKHKPSEPREPKNFTRRLQQGLSHRPESSPGTHREPGKGKPQDALQALGSKLSYFLKRIEKNVACCSFFSLKKGISFHKPWFKLRLFNNASMSIILNQLFF